MSGYVDLDELKDRVFFRTATHDDRFVFEEIEPGPDHSDEAELSGDRWVWADGTSRFKITGCAHRDADREGDVCGHCGKSFAKTRWAARRKR